MSPWTSDMEAQDLGFAPLGFGLALLQYVLSTPPFLPFGVVGNVYSMPLYVGSM